MNFEPYIVAGGAVVAGGVTTGAGAALTIVGYASMPKTGPAGFLVGTAAGLPVAGFGLYQIGIGIDIYVDQMRHLFGLPAWFDVIKSYDFFPPHGQ